MRLRLKCTSNVMKAARIWNIPMSKDKLWRSVIHKSVVWQCDYMVYNWMACTGIDDCYCWGFLCVMLGEYLKEWSTKSWHMDVPYQDSLFPRICGYLVHEFMLSFVIQIKKVRGSEVMMMNMLLYGWLDLKFKSFSGWLGRLFDCDWCLYLLYVLRLCFLLELVYCDGSWDSDWPRDFLMIQSDRRSKEDDVNNISTSIFVTNFPDSTRDLWRMCNQYGNVIDAFIPNRRSKAGKRFGFVRFIKVFEVDRLVNNLCTIWFDRLRLHANIAKFNRGPLKPKVNVVNMSSSGGSHNVNGTFRPSNSYVHVVTKGHLSQPVAKDLKPALVLDDDCAFNSDLSLAVFGKLKEFESLSNIKKLLATEGFDDVVIRYMGGYWILLQFNTLTTKDKFMAHVGVNSWFSKLQQASHDFKIDERGSLLHEEEDEETHFHRKRICIKTTLDENIFETFKIIVKGKIFWIRAKEVTGWTPDFNDCDEDLSDTDDDAQTDHGDIKSTAKKGKISKDIEDGQSADPFNLYDLLKKKKHVSVEIPQTQEEPKYPPGFTPCVTSEVNSNVGTIPTRGLKEHNKNSHNMAKVSPVTKHVPNSNTKEDDVGISNSSGHFRSVGAPKSGGSILLLMEDLIKVGQTMGYKMDGCINNFERELKRKWNRVASLFSVWDPKISPGEIQHYSDYFIAIMGKWKGDVIIMGDFNEVRCQKERFGSIFNSQGAAAFNNFISLGDLVEVSSRGYSFTWSHKSASKMSKLDRFLISDSLLRFCPNISALILDRLVNKLKLLKNEIRKWVKDNNDESKNHKYNLKQRLAEIDSLLDKGEGSTVILEERMSIMSKLIDLDNIDLLALAQKAKIKWSIEGDENTKKIHGIINKFNSPCLERFVLDMDFPNKLTTDHKNDLERPFTKEEIKGAIWDCGLNKSPGPDWFTFGFYRRYWNLLEYDIMEVVNHFYFHGFCPKGGNSSFIALIPKTFNAKLVKDFRPISLIGSLYKIIAKILANRLVLVMGDLVNEVQSAFIDNRNILDGPFILNEVMQWSKAKKKQTMIFKVDFEKAFDSVR
ncbi:RNA-directed DNA polymerase, eukaryota [Tanacetum coccineum]